MRATDKQSLLADRAAVQGILDSIPEDDELGRISFTERLADIESQLARYGGDDDDHVGRVALIFNGDPVRGSRSIDAVFAGNALKTFQDLVSKQLAFDAFGELGARGPLPLRARTNLAVSNIVRGSVGFELEEAIENEELADTAIKKAIGDVTNMIQKTAADDLAAFEEVISSLDHRFLVSLREFFHNLDDSNAQVRILLGERDTALDSVAVHRGRERVDNTEFDDREDDNMIGELLGLLPERKRFEMRLRDGQTISGTVLASVAERYLEMIEGPRGGVVGRWWRVKMKIREVLEPNKPSRQLYSLVGLLEAVETPR